MWWESLLILEVGSHPQNIVLKYCTVNYFDPELSGKSEVFAVC